MPRGGRYIHILRDPRDVMVSFYHFFDGWVMERGSIPIDTFVVDFLMAGTRSGNYWDHLLSWWPQRHAPDTLMLCYEGVVADLAGTVARVARFIGLPEDPQRLAVATRQASMGFMKAHETQFDDHPLRALRNPAMGLPLDAASSKVRSGRVGGHAGALSAEVLARLDERWQERVAAHTGHASYAHLREDLEAGARSP